jgi:peptidoglycan hydrolase-like protein with peptidoglycan-binding domain
MDRSNAGPKMMRSQRVQEFLILNGFAVSIDGDFGPATEKRVRDFQTARGLPATGVVDIKTQEELVAPIVKALNPIAAGGKSLSALAAAYARQHIKNRPREAGGDNRGPWVRSSEKTQDGALASSALRSSRRPTRSASTFRSTPHHPPMCRRWKQRRPGSSCQNGR